MSHEIAQTSVLKVTDRQVSSDFLEDEIVVLDIHDGAYYVLNPVAAQIWSLLQEPRRVSELIDTLLETYDVSRERCTDEVLKVLRQLAEKSLIDIENEGR